MPRTKFPLKRITNDRLKVPYKGGTVETALSSLPNCGPRPNVTGLRLHVYGADAKLIRCGAYVYNADSMPDLYNQIAQ